MPLFARQLIYVRKQKVDKEQPPTIIFNEDMTPTEFLIAYRKKNKHKHTKITK